LKSKAPPEKSATESIFQLETATDHANAQTSTGANYQQSPKANPWEPAQQPVNTCSQLEQNTLTDPYAIQLNAKKGQF
jgi:hypothetical protein